MSLFFRRKVAFKPIKMFHRIGQDSQMDYDPLSRISITSDEFERIITFWKNEFDIIPLEEYLTIKSKRERRNKVVITFDDGYSFSGFDILGFINKYKIPITIYLVSDFLYQRSVPHEFVLRELVNSVDSLQFHDKEFLLKDVSTKALVYKKLNDLFMRRQQNNFFDKNFELQLFFEKCFNKVLTSKMMLDKAKVTELKSNPLITFGNHSKSHIPMTEMTTDEMINQIIIANNELEQVTDSTPKHFSFPYGKTTGEMIDKIKSLDIFESIVLTDKSFDGDQNFTGLVREEITSELCRV